LNEAKFSSSLKELQDNSQLEDDFDFDRSLKKNTTKKKNKFSLNMMQIPGSKGFQDEFEDNIENLSESWQEQMMKERR